MNDKAHKKAQQLLKKGWRIVGSEIRLAPELKGNCYRRRCTKDHQEVRVRRGPVGRTQKRHICLVHGTLFEHPSGATAWLRWPGNSARSDR